MFNYNQSSQYQDRDKVSWNIASAQARHITYLLYRMTSYYLEGNLGKWYWHISALREMINYNLNEFERAELDELERLCNIYNSKWEEYKKSVDIGEENFGLKKYKSLFSMQVRKYQRRVMDILKDLGYFPAKEDKTKLSF